MKREASVEITRFCFAHEILLSKNNLFLFMMIRNDYSTKVAANTEK